MRQLSTTQIQIAEQACRYGMTTPDIVSDSFLNGDLIAAHAALRPLTKGDKNAFLFRRPLFGRRIYLQPAPRLAREFGHPEEISKPFGPQATPQRFAVLNFCCGEGRNFKRFTRKEFHESFPELLAQGVPFNDYFLDTQETGEIRLQRIIVDLGGDADRLIRKLLSIVEKFSLSPKGLSFLHAGAFGFTVITTSEHKAQALRAAFKKSGATVSFLCAIDSELLQLLPNFYE